MCTAVLFSTCTLILHEHLIVNTERVLHLYVHCTLYNSVNTAFQEFIFTLVGENYQLFPVILFPDHYDVCLNKVIFSGLYMLMNQVNVKNWNNMVMFFLRVAHLLLHIVPCVIMSNLT